MTKPSSHPGRVFVAILLAPLIGCIGGLYGFMAVAGEPVSVGDTGQLLETAGIVWLYSLPLAVPLGLLVHWALLRLKFWPVTAYAVTGMLLGAPALYLFMSVIIGSPDGLLASPKVDSEGIWLGAITGGITALAFRLLVHRGSDDTEDASFPQTGTRP